MTFSDQIKYNILFQKVVNKGGETEINSIKIFQNAKALGIPVGNNYSEEQLMQIY